ncbi:MAG: hypothetical protein R3C45_22030 [Phycisphaerales bacterium]
MAVIDLVHDPMCHRASTGTGIQPVADLPDHYRLADLAIRDEDRTHRGQVMFFSGRFQDGL